MRINGLEIAFKKCQTTLNSQTERRLYNKLRDIQNNLRTKDASMGEFESN